MSQEEIEGLESSFGNYLSSWASTISSWMLEKRVEVVPGGGIGVNYHVPYRIGFSEKDGSKYVFVRAGWMGEGLVEAIEREYDDLPRHLEALARNSKTDPCSRGIDLERFFNGREVTEEFPEGGIGFTNVLVKVKGVPEDLDLFFRNIMCGVVKPTMRAVDKVRERR